MDEERTDPRAELAAGESGGAGPHCGLKRLIAYREGTLPAAERERVQEHLSLCPRCTGLLRELRDFEEAAARGEAGPEPLRQEAWDSLVRRLPAKTPAIRPVASEPRQPRRSPRFALGALAAAQLLAIVGLTLWMERTEKAAGRAPEGRDPIIVALREIEVSVAPRYILRGHETPGSGFLRGGGAVNPVRTMPRDDRFAVAFSLSDHPAYDEYRLELLERDGKTLWSGRRPGASMLGDAGTSVSIRGLGPGLYRLRIEGLRPDGGEPLAEYLLRVEA